MFSVRYAFDREGGFAVVDNWNRVASYAFPTSPDADAAKRNPSRVAGRMLKSELPTYPENAEIVERLYLRVAEKMEGQW